VDSRRARARGGRGRPRRSLHQAPATGVRQPVAERGATLSVGQKQLLSFARALAFDPRILVLDEATSSVDTQTELLIRDALHALMAGRTTIAIAHRLSTIQDMDKILVLHKGRLREAGRHQDLLARRARLLQAYQLRIKIRKAEPRNNRWWTRGTGDGGDCGETEVQNEETKLTETCEAH
jgi:ATP-binding cassette subfamily B protein